MTSPRALSTFGIHFRLLKYKTEAITPTIHHLHLTSILFLLLAVWQAAQHRLQGQYNWAEEQHSWAEEHKQVEGPDRQAAGYSQVEELDRQTGKHYKEAGFEALAEPHQILHHQKLRFEQLWDRHSILKISILNTSEEVLNLLSDNQNEWEIDGENITDIEFSDSTKAIDTSGVTGTSNSWTGISSSNNSYSGNCNRRIFIFK